MLAPSGQYLKENQPCWLCVSPCILCSFCLHVDFITALWLQPISSFFIYIITAAEDHRSVCSIAHCQFKKVLVHVFLHCIGLE